MRDWLGPTQSIQAHHHRQSREKEKEKKEKIRKENGNESKLFGLIVSIFLWGRLDILKKKKKEEKELVDVLGGRERKE
jgi:hypothetical protein